MEAKSFEINGINIDIKDEFARQQLNNIANKTIIENNKLYLVKSDGTKLDEGTELPVSTGTILSNNIETYKTEDIGELFTAKADYVAWCMTLQYDKTLDKFVALINNANAHLFSSCSHSLYFIDAYNFTISEIKEIPLDAIQIAICNFIILDDGTYIFICDGGTRSNRGNNHKYTSNDKGDTWVDNGEVTGIVDGASYHLWNLKKLSNGRLIAGIDVANKGIVYSDDNGSSWSIVVPSGGSGDYKAEACIIELETNKLMAIARKNMSGTGYNSSGDSDKALISYSEDNGSNWSDWTESNSIDNMNASCCDGLVHDGIVEVFATSRWYKNGDYSCTDYDNTGKTGAMIHYTATVENALKDSFTKKGIIDYAKGASGEYHAPSVAVDSKGDILIQHMDGGNSVTCNQRFLRGSLGNLSYLATDGSKSSAKAYSAKYTDILFENILSKVNTLQYALSQIEGSGVDTPTGTLIWTKQFSTDTASKPITSDTDSSFYSYATASYTTNSVVTFIGEDTRHDNVLTYQSYSLIIKVPVSKSNFAVYVNGATGRVDGSMASASHNVRCALVIDNIMYELKYTNLSIGTVYTKLKIEYNGGKLVATKDEVEVEVTETTLDSSSEFYGQNYAIIGNDNNNYCCYREIKFGEWDS